MPFITKLDFSDNRQVKQRIETIQNLSGATTFGVTFNALPTGPDLTTSAITLTTYGVASTFSGNPTETIFTWYDSNMGLADSVLSAITPSNSATTQNTGSIFTADTTTIIDGNTIVLTYTGVSFDVLVIAMVDLGGSTYSGTVNTTTLNYLSAGTLDFTGRTIWSDTSGITRTERLIVTNNPQIGYVLTCIDSEGMTSWSPSSGGSSGSTVSIWTAGTGTSSAVLSGSSSVATGDYSVAEGNSSIASGIASHAEGAGTLASGGNSHAEGNSTTATADYSHAEGGGTKASGDTSHAEGSSTTASGYASHSEGQDTIASGDYGAHAEGYLSTSSGVASHAEGISTTASGLYSHAEGQETTASGNYGGHAEGYLTTASGNWSSHAEGYYTIASGINGSHAEGFGSHAFGYGSHAEGIATIALGNYSHAEGEYTIASGSSSHAEGNITIASGLASHAEGLGTLASGNSSHSEGDGTIASGDTSHAEGFYTTASGQASHSEGSGTTAVGIASHAGGYNSIASGTTSFVFGTSSVAGGNSTIVLGDNITGTISNVTYVEDLVIDGLTSTDPLATDADGKIVAGVSDARLKQNIQNLSNSLNIINNLRGVSFEFTEASNMGPGTRYGFIAQEVQKVIPDIVRQRAKSDGMLNLNYNEVVPIIVEAIKELSNGTSNNTHLETQTILAEDNNIELNYGGNQQTALGGGITVLHAKGESLNAELITDENGDWKTNNDFKAKSLTIPTFTPTSSNDETGNEGNITRDDDYMYIKTKNGWKRSNLENF